MRARKEQFTGKEQDTETGSYYFGARYYNPTTSAWESTDPYGEGYPDMSPYNYANRNPVIYTDPTGAVIIDRYGIFADFVAEVRRKIQEIYEEKEEFKAHGSKKSEEQWKTHFQNLEKLEALEQILEELHALHMAEQGYELLLQVDPFGEKGGATHYDPLSKRVKIFVEGPRDFPRWAHELKHAYQFQVGELSFDYTGAVGGALYDLVDEENAYARSRLFKGVYHSIK